jgi:hypothetical protein
MDINTFALKVTKKEGGKINLSNAQVKEVLHIANDLTKGLLYAVIRWLK